MKTLLIDNHDSFTYNLFQLLAEVNGEEPDVVRNDELSWSDLRRRSFDNVVISPGPGRPERPEDFGACAEAIASADVPLLGVCLGLQGLAWVCGGRVVSAPEPVHGRVGTVVHDGSPLFAGIPREFEAVRYHSLAVGEPLPDDLEPLAWALDGVLMAAGHRTRPRWGVQFHPESICTEHGRRLLENFRDSTSAASPVGDRGGRRGRVAASRAGVGDPARPAPDAAGARGQAAGPQAPPAGPAPLELHVERLDRLVDPELAFGVLHGQDVNAFWLDGGGDERSRFSFVGSDGGPLGALVTYDVAAGELTVERGGRTEVRDETVFDFLDRELGRLRVEDGGLPFDLDGGFVGYLGYECKADCGGAQAHASLLPDAAFVLAGRVVAFDHRERRTYVVAVAEPGDAAAERGWVDATARRLAALAPAAEPRPAGGGGREADAGHRAGPDGPDRSPDLRPGRTRTEYIADVERCRELLEAGESYEICLTTRIETEAPADPLAAYRELRRASPAPFSAYLRFGETAVLSSSPERFLRIDRAGAVEAKPIKGTASRGATPAEDARLASALVASAKDRAENLMIVDLLRNDLGSVCAIGSVHVPELMAVESYAEVHQLVSTVRGALRDGAGPADCVRACFPPGSMTGAPKERTMEILDELEPGPRGVYSGAIGYLGLGGGCELSVAIRTIVSDGETASVGAGGAVVVGSDAAEEHAEMALKARAPLRALAPGLDVEAALSREPVRPA